MKILYTIRARIGILFTLLILIVMAGLTIFLSNFVRQSSLDDLEIQLEHEAVLVGSLIEPLISEPVDIEQIDAKSKEIGQRIGARVTIIAENGDVLGEAWEDRKLMENHANRPEIIQAGLKGKGSEIRFSDTVGYEMIYIAVPIERGGERLGFARVAVSLQSVEKKIALLQRSLVGAAMAAALLAGLLAIWLSNRITSPLRDLIEAAQQMASGGLDKRLIPAAQDEIGKLTETFNSMAFQLNNRVNDLEAERSRISAVLNAMSDGVIIIDTDNRVQLINPSAQAMFDAEPETALGHSLFEFVRLHQIDELLIRCRESGEPQTVSIEPVGFKLNFQVTAKPLGPAQPGNTMLLFQDLTRVRKLETIRKDFISNISHELRTPLASLRALAETLHDSALDDPPVARRFLDRMQTEIDTLTQMVEELLELSRIELGKVPLEKIPCSPRKLIEQAVERLSMQAERAGVFVEIDCPADLPNIQADSSRLVQVIVNLLHNAIKFSSPGGKIVVRGEKQADEVVFSVEDNGIGIASDDLARIFERFFKSDRARASGGTGLGLAISRHIVEAHGGRIWVTSREGEGSTFFVSIPI